MKSLSLIFGFKVTQFTDKSKSGKVNSNIGSRLHSCNSIKVTGSQARSIVFGVKYTQSVEKIAKTVFCGLGKCQWRQR